MCTFDADGIRSTDAFGYADLTRSEPVTPGTIFRVASVSKLFTTMLVLRLADAGVLDLEAPLNHYLPEHLRIVDGEGAPAGSTLASVLSHTSGLPVGVRGATPGNAVVSYVANQGRVRNLAEAIAGLTVVRPVGAQVVYSNPAFNVAGYVAAAAMGTTFEAAVHDQVLGPLAMTSAQFAPRNSGPGVATPYGSIVPPAVGAGSAAALRLVATPMGGLSTNVVELARFGQMVLDGGRIDGEQFLRTATLDAATTLRATNHPDLDAGYGLGFRVRTWHGRRIVGHDGNMPGVATQMMIAPDDGVGVAVLTNGYSLSVPHEIAAMALRHALGVTARTTATVDGTDAALTRAAASLGDRIQGVYRQRDASPPGLVGRLNDAGVRVTVTHEVDGRLRLDGNPGSDGPAWLLPAGRAGRYRVAAGVDDDTTAVVDEQPDGTHLWIGHTTHLHRRPSREG